MDFKVGLLIVRGSDHQIHVLEIVRSKRTPFTIQRMLFNELGQFVMQHTGDNATINASVEKRPQFARGDLSTATHYAPDTRGVEEQR